MASDAEIENGVSIEAHVAIGYREVARMFNFCKDLGMMICILETFLTLPDCRY